MVHYSSQSSFKQLCKVFSRCSNILRLVSWYVPATSKTQLHISPHPLIYPRKKVERKKKKKKKKAAAALHTKKKKKKKKCWGGGGGGGGGGNTTLALHHHQVSSKHTSPVPDQHSAYHSDVMVSIHPLPFVILFIVG